MLISLLNLKTTNTFKFLTEIKNFDIEEDSEDNLSSSPQEGEEDNLSSYQGIN